MNLCFGERMQRNICSPCFHINRQLTHPFCPVHTQPKQPYKLTDKHSREFKEGDFQRGQTQRGAQPSFVGPPLTPCRRHALHRTSGSSGQTRNEQTTPSTIYIIYSRAAKVCLRTTERAQASDYANRSVRARTANMGAASTLHGGLQ